MELVALGSALRSARGYAPAAALAWLRSWAQRKQTRQPGLAEWLAWLPGRPRCPQCINAEGLSCPLYHRHRRLTPLVRVSEPTESSFLLPSRRPQNFPRQLTRLFPYRSRMQVSTLPPVTSHPATRNVTYGNPTCGGGMLSRQWGRR